RTAVVVRLGRGPASSGFLTHGRYQRRIGSSETVLGMIAPPSSGVTSIRATNLLRSLCGQSDYVAPARAAARPIARGRDRTPHKRSCHSVRRKSIRPASSFHGWPSAWPSTSQRAKALAFISRSTSAYTFVVLSDTCPSHARIVLISTHARSRWV